MHNHMKHSAPKGVAARSVVNAKGANAKETKVAKKKKGKKGY